jgi:hypothetical protein
MEKRNNDQVVVKSSKKAKIELKKIGASLEGKELFKQKVDNAKKILSSIKSLPV